jgi:GntR family transcriptional regulator, rspAB operon transcriptional repressor
MLVKKVVQRSSAQGEEPYGALPQLQGGERGGLTDGVACALREAIISWSWDPGMMIVKLAVCERMEVSRYPVSATTRYAGTHLFPTRESLCGRVDRFQATDLRVGVVVQQRGAAILGVRQRIAH